MKGSRQEKSLKKSYKKIELNKINTSLKSEPAGVDMDHSQKPLKLQFWKKKERKKNTTETQKHKQTLCTFKKTVVIFFKIFFYWKWKYTYSIVHN